MVSSAWCVEGSLVSSMVQRSSLYPGVREGLDYMKAAGYTLGCVTNKAAQFTIPLLKDLGIYDDFENIVCGDTLATRKSH